MFSKGLFRGIKEDLERRRPHYKSDWIKGWNLKVLASILYMFFTSLGPGVSFSEFLYKRTNQQIGPVEVILSTSLSGIIFSILSGQPLIILGVTGPVSILTISIYNISNSFNINFLTFYSWTQIWSSLFHMLIAMFNLCDYIYYISKFSCDIFGMLIAIIYFFTGVTGIISYFKSDSFSESLLQLILSYGTFHISQKLSCARKWSFCNNKIRSLISDYSATLSIVIWSGVSFLGKAKQTNISYLDIQQKFQPTLDRNWIVNIGDLEIEYIILSIIPGCILTMLFIFDHNVSSLMTQNKDFGLKKGTSFHLDFFVLGLCIFVTGILGIPPCNGLIPQAPLHVLSLREERVVNGKKSTFIHEQRLSNLCQSLMLLIMCFPPFLHVLGCIPRSILDGLFIFMSTTSFENNELVERILLFMTQKELRSSDSKWFNEVDFRIVNRFTLIQSCCCLLIFSISLTPISIIFPALIILLIYLRLHILPKFFTELQLQALDFIKIKKNTTCLKSIEPNSSSDNEVIIEI